MTPELVIPNATAAAETASQAASRPIRREPAESRTAGRDPVFPQIDTTDQPRQRRGTTRKVRQTRQSTTLIAAAAIATVAFVLSILAELLQSGGYGASDPVRMFARAGITAIAAPIAVAIYIMPTLIAYNRGHRNAVPIFVINFFAGSLVLPWIGCLAWALSSHVEESRQTVRVVQVNQRGEVLDL
jgi:hypothetical protein